MGKETASLNKKSKIPSIKLHPYNYILHKNKYMTLLNYMNMYMNYKDFRFVLWLLIAIFNIPSFD